MPTTICTTCQRTENWRNGKGSHGPVTCPRCHTDTLVPARYISRTADAPGHYEPAPARPRAHMVVCPICGRKRRSDSASLHIYDHPADVEADTYHVGQNDRWIPDIVCVPANTAHCWHHTVVGDFNCPVCGRRPRVVQDGYFCPSCARRLSALDITL